jgi:hypothetical protein
LAGKILLLPLLCEKQFFAGEEEGGHSLSFPRRLLHNLASGRVA